MATRKTTNCCHSDGQIMPSISVKSVVKRRKFRRFVCKNVFVVHLISFGAFWALSCAQYQHNPNIGDRDPRFYSRPGVDYKPPNPGDKEYR